MFNEDGPLPWHQPSPSEDTAYPNIAGSALPIPRQSGTDNLRLDVDLLITPDQIAITHFLIIGLLTGQVTGHLSTLPQKLPDEPLAIIVGRVPGFRHREFQRPRKKRLL